MNRFLSGSAVLYLALHAATAPAQNAAIPTVDALYEQGQHALTASWRPLGKRHDAAVFLHQNIKKADNGRLAVWRDTEYPFPDYFEKEHAYLSSRERVVIDCKAATFGISETSYYAERFGKGEVVGTSKATGQEMSDAVPDSLEEHLINTACAPKPRSKPAHKKAATKPAGDKQAASEAPPGSAKNPDGEKKSAGSGKPAAGRQSARARRAASGT